MGNETEPGLEAFPPELRERYRPQKVLGRGGMGVVYLARSLALDRPVAVKVARRLGDDAASRIRFSREAQVLTRLKGPSLPVVYEHGEGAGEPWLVMEYLDGEDLATAGPAMEPAARIEALLEVAGALEQVHGAGLAHRDVKPANMIRTRDGRVVLADFGLVWDPARTRITELGQVVGTFAYIAPELLDGRLPGPASDWYAWAASLFVLLEGRPPYPVAALLETYRGRPLPPPVFATIPPQGPLAGLLADMLRADPAARPGSVHELRMRLGRTGPWPTRPPPAPTPGPVPGPAAPPAARPPARAGLAVLGLGAVLLVGGLALGSPGRDRPAVPEPTPSAERVAEAVETLGGLVDRARSRVDRFVQGSGAIPDPGAALAALWRQGPPEGGRELLAGIRAWSVRERETARSLLAGAGPAARARQLERVLERLVGLQDLWVAVGLDPGPEARELLGLRLPCRFEDRSLDHLALARPAPGRVDLGGPWVLVPPDSTPEQLSFYRQGSRFGDVFGMPTDGVYGTLRDGREHDPVLEVAYRIPDPGGGTLVLHQVHAWRAWKLAVAVGDDTRAVYLPRGLVAASTMNAPAGGADPLPRFADLPTVRIPLPEPWARPGEHRLRLAVSGPGPEPLDPTGADPGGSLRIGRVTLEGVGGGKRPSPRAGDAESSPGR